MTVWHEIGDHIWVRRYAFFDQTIGVVGGADGLLVIDTRTSHRWHEDGWVAGHVDARLRLRHTVVVFGRDDAAKARRGTHLWIK